MIVKCDRCKMYFEDVYRSTLCPHAAFPANDGRNNFTVHDKAYLSKFCVTEKQEAVQLANQILDRPSADPDDDLAMLSRQFLRALEVIDKQERALKEVDWEGAGIRDLIEANRDAILRMHEEAVKRIARVLSDGTHDAEKVPYIRKVLHALNTFHPMHGESWCGWPEE